MSTLSPKWIKILKTINLYLCFFTLGLCVAVPGPCLLDLQHIVQTTTQQIAFIYTARSVGYLIGSIGGGFILDAVKSKQTVMTILNSFVALSMIGIPWSRHLIVLAGFMIINGVSLGAVDIGGNVICLTLWGSESGPFYQALHFTFGLGGLVAPLIAAPFLGDFAEDDYYSSTGDNATYPNNLTNISTGYDYYQNNSSDITIPNIVYPFSVIGGFSLAVTIMFLAICLVSPMEGKGKEGKNKDNPNSKLSFLLTVIILNFFLLFVETGTEIGYAQMLTTYVVKGRLKLTSSAGSYMTSAFWAAFTVSRLASVFLAIKLDNFTLIVGDLVISSVGAVILLFLASYEWAMWLASVLLGIGIASFFPAAVGWLDSYINVTNKIASFFTVGAAFGEMLIPFTITYYIDTVPDVLIYLVPVSCVSSSILVGILYFILRKRERKCVKKEPECFTVSGPTVNPSA